MLPGIHLWVDQEPKLCCFRFWDFVGLGLVAAEIFQLIKYSTLLAIASDPDEDCLLRYESSFSRLEHRLEDGMDFGQATAHGRTSAVREVNLQLGKSRS